jgi:hypothetical protein
VRHPATKRRALATKPALHLRVKPGHTKTHTQRRPFGPGEAHGTQKPRCAQGLRPGLTSVAHPALESRRYCLSYTAMPVTFFPLESVPSVVTVRDLPSGERTMVPVKRTLAPFLTVNASV